MDETRFVIITGLSGAGKSIAIKCFEDSGFFCVDNIPPQLIFKFAEICLKSKGKLSKIALVVDIRGGIFFKDLFSSFDHLKELGINTEIFFLEASDDVLVHRFSGTRRKHPLNISDSMLENIQAERKRLKGLRSKANLIIDTSDLTPKQLSNELIRNFIKDKSQNIQLNLISFGYKYGIPIDVDIVFDVRFIPNPFYVETLKSLPGTDKQIQKYVTDFLITQKFMEAYFNIIGFLIPYYLKEGKTYLSIAFGCTGGRHRSVVLINKLASYLQGEGYKTSIKHRDLSKEERVNENGLRAPLF
ncbi:MAG: RNase adapter RapZ [Candidatus Caldatribacteriota bacterium]|nr:RNase adapter RapZ [Candidatus Caldatribacteriota bacterium]